MYPITNKLASTGQLTDSGIRWAYALWDIGSGRDILNKNYKDTTKWMAL